VKNASGEVVAKAKFDDRNGFGHEQALSHLAAWLRQHAATRAEVLRASIWAAFALDEVADASGGPRTTRGPGPSAFIIPTDEKLMIARAMRDVLGGQCVGLAYSPRRLQLGAS
jgi:hypothetical protein